MTNRLKFKEKHLGKLTYYVAELDGKELTKAMSLEFCKVQAAKEIKKLAAG